MSISVANNTAVQVDGAAMSVRIVIKAAKISLNSASYRTPGVHTVYVNQMSGAAALAVGQRLLSDIQMHVDGVL